MSGAAFRRLLREAFVRALRSVDLGEAVARAMPRLPAAPRAVTVLAIGKAANAMAAGAFSAAGDRVTCALVVRPTGVRSILPQRAGVEVCESAHPDPDARSVDAARRAIHLVAASDFTLALVSGGASSLICLPLGLTLARYVRVVRGLLLGGADVREVNLVRRHLCAVKGGGLARVAKGPVCSLVASDVIGGSLHDVGSGPTVPDPTTRAQARAVLRRVSPGSAPPPLHESLKPGSPQARGARGRFVARPEDLARATAGELRAQGLTVSLLRPSVASVAELAGDYERRARRLRPGEAVVRSAEPSLRVDVERPGRGGRSTHLAVLLSAALPPGVAFLAAASDGIDGASATAGAVVDASLRRFTSPDAAARSLARFDTGSLVLDASMALRGAPTDHNLADVHVLARAP